ncbi:MAG: hypothetical protein AB8H79_07330 [Myxococcota bacterium]
MRLLILTVMAVCLPSVALACGGHVEVAVVGWSPKGHAVVRTQHNNDDGLHALELDLIGPGPERHWDILTEADNQDPNIRGARWKKAEAELLAIGVVFEPTKKPTATPFTLSDGTTVETRHIPMAPLDPDDPENGLYRADLVVNNDAGTQFVTEVGYLPQHYADPSRSAVWHHPVTDNIVITADGINAAHRMVYGTSVLRAVTAPRTECHGYSSWRIVGWGAKGGPLVRIEQSGHPIGGSELCLLKLVTLAPDSREFPVVRPGDTRPDDVRRSRWPGVAKQLKANGVTLQSEPVQPVGSLRGKGLLDSIPVPGRPYTLEFVVDPAKDGDHATLHAQLRYAGRVTMDRVQVSVLPKGKVNLKSHDMYWSPSFDALVLVPERWWESKRLTVESLDAIWNKRPKR